MRLDEYCSLMRIKKEEEPNDEIVLAASYLQAIGYEFCVNFGFDNALEIAEREFQMRA